MCRLLAWKSRQPEQDVAALADSLRALRGLAATGRVPNGIPAGHRDGWGIAAFRDGAAVIYVRSAKPADEDPLFEATVAACAAAAPDAVIAHLRKASAGAIDAGNAQPFLGDNAAFAHNGSMGGRGGCDGPSDSLRFFREAVSRGGDIFEAVEALKNETRQGEYRAMNFLLTDGKKIRVWRDWNEMTPDAEALGLEGYYGLFRAQAASFSLVSSEPLALPNLTFELIQNGASVDLS
jgi:glutamine amidotransferase